MSWRVELWERRGVLLGWRVVRGKRWPFKETAGAFTLDPVKSGTDNMGRPWLTLANDLDTVTIARDKAHALADALNAQAALIEAFECEPIAHGAYPLRPETMAALERFRAAQIERTKHGV